MPRPTSTFEASEKRYPVLLTSHEINTVRAALWGYSDTTRKNDSISDEIRTVRLQGIYGAGEAAAEAYQAADADWWYGLGFSDGRWGSDPRSFDGEKGDHIGEYRKGFRAGVKAVMAERLSALGEED